MAEKLIDNNTNFTFNWVLRNKLAIGSAPISKKDILFLKDIGIDCILNLCFKNEYSNNSDFFKSIKYFRYPIPDHHKQEDLSLDEVFECLRYINLNFNKSKIFVHCLAGVERSPIICIAWLINQRKISLENAYIYLSQIHKPTNPLRKQLKLLMKNQKIIQFKEFKV